MNKKASGIILVMFLVGSLSLVFNIQPVKASGTIYIRADGSIDPPTANITTSDDVTYTFTANNTGSIVIERSNAVVDGAKYTLQGNGTDNGLTLLGENITVKRTNIRVFEYGIYINHTPYNTISENNIVNNTHGIFLDYLCSRNAISGNYVEDNDYGISIITSSENTVLNNVVTNNTMCGIRVSGFSFPYANNISNNIITNNDKYGLQLDSSFLDILSGNVVNDNKYNLEVDGTNLRHFKHSIDVSNLVNGEPVYYFINQKDLVINPKTHPQIGYLALINSTNVTVEDLTLTNNGQGLLLVNTNNSRITNNGLINNNYGIHLHQSFNNTIEGNTIKNNTDYGAYFYSSSNWNTLFDNNLTRNERGGVGIFGSVNNMIYRNTIINNGYGVTLGFSSANAIHENSISNNSDICVYLYSSSASNIISRNNITNNGNWGVYFDSGSSNNLIGHNNFINTHQVYPSSSVNTWDNGVEGNYWSDYAGVDVNPHDGIGDSPYVISANNQDNYPLMSPYIAGDYNHDSVVNMTDVDMVRAAWQCKTGDLNYNPHVDFNMDGIINIADVAMIGVNWGKHA